MDALTRMQTLLRDLFQLDMADLDFGIYRLLHIKRAEVDAFINEQLPQRVHQAFSRAGERELAELAREAEQLKLEIVQEAEDPDAIASDGSVTEACRQRSGRTLRGLVATYETVRSRLDAVRATEAQNVEVFNHLYAFFSRYYENGDFIPRLRRGANETYAVPYDGQEVYLHWANKDQHYVKTGERFRDYAFTVHALGGPYRVRFVLTQATVPKDNTKGDVRFFFPRPDAVQYQEQTLTLPFEYRLPTEEEVSRYGKNTRGQEAVLQETLEPILKAVPEDALAVALGEIVRETDKERVNLLLHRLRHFARKQTSDYFVHRDLKGFLTREFEFYIKDQVLNLADIQGDLQSKLRMIGVLRDVGNDIITFLDQIERVQCRLFEKQKFVLRTDYLYPIQHLPRELWPEVLASEAQLRAWRDLFAIEGEVDQAFAETHPTLVVDTSHFDESFKLRLLASFDDMDQATGGLLIHSENYQALRWLQGRYRGAVKCIYIDPPYNTGSDEFVYKDRYQHSSWLSMMADRLALARDLMPEDSAVFVSISDEETDRLQLLMDAVFGERNHRNTIIARRYDKNINRQFMRRGLKSLNVGVEFVLVYANSDSQFVNSVFREPSEERRTQGYWKGFWNSADRPTMRYELLGVKPTRGQWKWKEQTALEAVANYEEYLAHYAGEVCLEEYWETTGGAKRFIRRNPKGRGVNRGVEHWIPPSSGILRNSNWTDILASKSTEYLGLSYDNPKNVQLIEQVVLLGANADDLTLDFFAGSATTGHAVLRLNRRDGGHRRFILVEMADYFGTVLLPRIQKVMYCPDWKNGQPKGYPEPTLEGVWPDWVDRTPRLVKVVRLESYEDSLHNLVTEETLTQEAPRANAHKEAVGGDTYRLHYLARLPLEESASLLDTEKLEHPFDYTLEILTDDGPKPSRVDLVETFNALCGLHVERVRVWRNEADGREYRAISAGKDGRRVLVLWRDMQGLDPAVERAFLESKTGGYDQVLINGDCAVPGVRSLDPIFKRLMESGER